MDEACATPDSGSMTTPSTASDMHGEITSLLCDIDIPDVTVATCDMYA
jgi:hypothetical protein